MNKHIEKLKGIAEAMGMAFLYESYPRLNLLLDKFKRVGGEVRMPNNVTLPLCICVQPIAGSWAIHPMAGERRERQDCIVAFADAMPLDFTGEQADAVSESLKGLATEFIDRFLVTCEAYKVPVTILLAKIDLARTQPEAVEEFHAIYESAGYRIIEVSATEGEGVDEVRELLRGKTTLLSGNSGVGKSSFINAIDTSKQVKTGDISRAHQTGMHTTTYAEMYEVENGRIIDIPGIKGFGIIDMEAHEIGHYFPEIFQFSKECRFDDCLHQNEPDCAVRKALQEHKISESRYQSYLSILADISTGKYR